MYKSYAVQWETKDVSYVGNVETIEKGGKLFATRREAISYYRQCVSEFISGGFTEAKVTLKGMLQGGEIEILAEVYDKIGLDIEVIA